MSGVRGQEMLKDPDQLGKCRECSCGTFGMRRGRRMQEGEGRIVGKQRIGFAGKACCVFA